MILYIKFIIKLIKSLKFAFIKQYCVIIINIYYINILFDSPSKTLEAVSINRPIN